MNLSGNTSTQNVVKEIEVKPTVKWGYCDINPITQVLEYYLSQRKNNG